MRIALFTLESPLSAEAVAEFLRRHGGQVVLIGRSPPSRPQSGSTLGQAWRHLCRSGPRLLPYLIANYVLPQGLGQLRRRLGGGGGILAQSAAARGLPLVDLDDVNDAAAAAIIRAARPDILVSCHFDQIFTAATLALAPLGGINLHPSLLPRHRSPVPCIWALAEAPPAFGVTVHRLVPRIDAGAILAQRAVALPPGTTASAAARALHLAGIPLLGEALAALGRGGTPERTPAPLAYCPFPPPALLRRLAAQGARLVDTADLRAAIACRIG